MSLWPFLFALLLLFAVSVLAGCGTARENRIVVGSKNFTEQVILGELIAQHLESKTGLRVDRRFYLSGTYICHQAILAGRIDLYVEYTGTALTAILKETPAGVSSKNAAPAGAASKDAAPAGAASKNASAAGNASEVHRRVKAAYAERFSLEVSEPLGFNNTFAIVIRGEDARRLELKTLSQAAAHTPQWRAGFGYEFLERPDGFPGLARTYGLRFGSAPRIMELGLLYRALKEKQVDLVAGNSTDGLIAALDLAVLEDDRSYFPPYEAVPVGRQETLARHPAMRQALAELAGRISEEEMRRLNYALDGQHRDVKEVVREFLAVRRF